jgi:hypothetical protein
MRRAWGENARYAAVRMLSAEMINHTVHWRVTEEPVAIERLTAGQAFHQTVQAAFLTGLAGASGFKERQWQLIKGGRGRVDLAVEVDGEEQMLVIIEIKGTDWDAIPANRVVRNLRRHLHQLQAHLDTAIEDMEIGQWEGIVGALLYPARPASAKTLATIEALADEQAIHRRRVRRVPSACWSRGQAWCRSRCRYGQLWVPGA